MANAPSIDELYGTLNVDNEFFMKRKLYRMCFCLLMLWTSIGCVVADTNCSGYKPSYPNHYCDCNATKYDRNKYLGSLPFDVQITDSVWFRSRSDLFLDGFTAYLYSDCDVQFDIYQNCTSHEPLYRVTIPKGQARDVTAESIKQKLESMGVGSTSMGSIYLCIYPIDGAGGRLMCYPYNTGYNSTCNDILSLLPGMTFVSSHAENVYEITPENIVDSYAMYMQCDIACQFSISRGSCDGATIAEFDFSAEQPIYLFDAELLKDVKAKGESLFAHFAHSASEVGRISLNEVAKVEVVADTTVCQGRVFDYKGIVATKTGVYYYDTVKVSDLEYEVYGYNVTFAEPELVYDTVDVKNSELPYNYRGQYVVDDYGSYDVMIHNAGECDEHVMLHVNREFATVVNKMDTALCDGKIFEYEGKSYINNISFTDSVWSSDGDVLNVNILNVTFISSVEYDTLALTKAEAVGPYRYKGITIIGFGDYYNPEVAHPECPYSLYLHVCHKVTTVSEQKEVKLCAGDVYEHNGMTYTADVVLTDTTWRDEDTQVETTTNVHFVVNEMRYDTLYLAYGDLPHIYKEVAEIRQLADTVVTLLIDGCDGDVQLHIEHKYTTIVEERDTTLCQGVDYVHKGVSYSESGSVTDSVRIDRDTYQITTTRFYFAAPEAQYDTLLLRAADLPYDYRGQQLTDFGDYEIQIHIDGECDEYVLLNVKHVTTTVTAEQDTTLCRGMAYEHNGASYFEQTVIIDSVWINLDTLSIITTNVYFAAPETQYDTLALYTTDLPYNYRGEEIADFGNYDVTVRHDGECDELYRLHVEHRIDTIKTVRDTMICFGGIYRYEKDGKNYIAKTDISFGSSQTLNADTFLIDSLYVRFASEPDVIYDTLLLRENDLPYSYNSKTINEFKDYYFSGLANIATKCKENVYLHVAQLTQQTIDITICEGDVYVHNGVEYTQPTTFVDSSWVDNFNFQITTTHVSFKAIETKYDTITLRTTDLPYDYRGELIVGFGEHDLMIDNSEVCDEHIMLYVEHLTTTMEVERDTAVCQGKIYEHSNGELYSEPATIVDSIWVNQDTLTVVITQVYFTEPEMEYDTVFVSAGELNRGYYYELVNQYIYSPGEYYYEILVEGECSRELSLLVVRSITTDIDDNESVEVKSQLIMIDGVIYIFYNGEYYTLMGERVKSIEN